MSEPDERGGTTLLVLALVVIGVVLSLGAARLGAAVSGKARAEAAADASALAAADALALGRGDDAAVADARETAAANGAGLVSCRCGGSDAVVVVEIRIRGLGGRVVRATAHAEVGAAAGDLSSPAR